jgi:hypothetical protein
MRNMNHRLERLERRTEADTSGLVITVAAAKYYALDAERCTEILRECGYLHSSPTVIRLTRIPDGLNARELERYLREHGDEICGRKPGSGSGPAASR